MAQDATPLEGILTRCTSIADFYFFPVATVYNRLPLGFSAARSWAWEGGSANNPNPHPSGTAPD